MTDGVKAKLVFDGGEVHIPSEMGVARDDQMQGSPAEQLTELAGRICYDSLGKGRPSVTKDGTQGYHDHIKQVGHGSVQEHFNFTIEIPLGTSNTLSNDPVMVANRRLLIANCCCNRPGVISLAATQPYGLRITVNLRSVLQWLSWSESFYGYVGPMEMQMACMLHRLGHEIAPHIIPESPEFAGDVRYEPGTASELRFDELQGAKIVAPISDHERWVSMYLSCSRGCSHELVRHGDFTAISQRSTRYVDESEGDWIEHPLMISYLRDRGCSDNHVFSRQTMSCARYAYDSAADALEHWLLSRGVDKTSARKQARGAARGYLGNALQTELIFSASVSQWKWMISQRASVFADAEIRDLFCIVLGQLMLSRYAGQFVGWGLASSPDKIGMVAVRS